MKMALLKISFAFNLVYLFSCSNKCNIGGIEVTELLSTVANERSIDYCALLKTANSGDSNSIKKLSLMEFNDAVGYDHGAVVIDLVLKIGEDNYLAAISNFNRSEKKIVESYLDIGLKYGSAATWKNKDLQDLFPKLYAFLNS